MLGSVQQVESLTVTALLDDYAGYETPFYAQHGISLLAEVSVQGDSRRIIIDVGQAAEPILYNMKLLGIDPASIDAVFLSHCHYDHTEGLVQMLRAIGKEIPVIAHPDIFRDNYVLDPFIRNIGITPKNGRAAVEAAGGQLFLSRQAVQIMPGVISSGEVPRESGFEAQGIGGLNLVDGELCDDTIEDDLTVAVNVKGAGLAVLTGCSHAGIVNIINHCRRLSGTEKMALVLGGFHLIEAADAQIGQTALALAEMNIAQVVAGHCTGLKACAQLASVLGDSFELLHSGKKITVKG